MYSKYKQLTLNIHMTYTAMELLYLEHIFINAIYAHKFVYKNSSPLTYFHKFLAYVTNYLVIFLSLNKYITSF